MTILASFLTVLYFSQIIVNLIRFLLEDFKTKKELFHSLIPFVYIFKSFKIARKIYMELE